jgi:hypothetical protein
MSDEQQQKTSDFPAIGSSGAIGILPNGFFAQKLVQRPTPSPAAVILSGVSAAMSGMICAMISPRLSGSSMPSIDVTGAAPAR